MADDEYNKKLESLQQYIPFLNNMIAQLKDPRKKNREQQLAKMVSLHSMITDKKKKLKLETLTKCEDVILKLYEKVAPPPFHHQRQPHSAPPAHSAPPPQSQTPITPSSPSPPRDIPKTKPVVIPTEKIPDRDSMLCQLGVSHKPIIDIYSSAADSLTKTATTTNLAQSKGTVFDRLGRRSLELSKPPISMEDLEALQQDVLTERMSLNELTDLRAQLQKQLKTSDDGDNINTTVRNTTILTKKALEKAALEKSKPAEVKPVTKTSPVPTKPVKVVKEPSSIFGSALSSIDNKIIESKSKDKERRNSVGSKKESSSDSEKKERRSSKDDKKSDHRDKDKTEKKTSDHKSRDKDRDRDKKDDDRKDKSKDRRSKDDSKRHDKRDHHDKDRKRDESRKDDKDKTKDEKKKDEEKKKEEKKVEEKPKDEPKPVEAPVYKRLADKYNPKPRKPQPENRDLTKKVSESIETSMRSTPIPFLEMFQKSQNKPQAPLTVPLLSPASSTGTLDNEVASFNRKPLSLTPQPVPAPLPSTPLLPLGGAHQNLQTIPAHVSSILANPNTTALINSVVNQFKGGRQTPICPPTPNAYAHHNVPSANQTNFQSNFSHNDFNQPMNNQAGGFWSNQHHGPRHPHPPNLNFQQQQRSVTPMPNNRFEQNVTPMPNNRFEQNVTPMPNNRFEQNVTPMPNNRFEQNVTPMPNNRFEQNVTPMPNNRFEHNATPMPNSRFDQMQPMDYYPPGSAPYHNSSHQAPPLLSPQYDNYEPRPQRQPPNEDFNKERDGRYRDDWRRIPPNNQRPPAQARDPRLSRDPRFREDPRNVAKNQRRESREYERDDRNKFRDPRLNRFQYQRERERERDPPREREREREPPRDREREREPPRDREQARGARQRSVSTESGGDSTFVSPLDSLYSGSDGYRKTGKGYGVQNFKIPKIKKDEEPEEVVEKKEDVVIEEHKEEVEEKKTVVDVKEEKTDFEKSKFEEKEEEVAEEPKEDVKKVVEPEPKKPEAESDENVASTSVSSSTECDSKNTSESQSEAGKDSAEISEISSTNDIPDSQPRDEPKALDNENQTDIINRFLKKLLENERTRAAASLFIDNVSNSLDDEKLKMVVQTVKSATVEEEPEEKRPVTKRKLVRKKLNAKLAAAKKKQTNKKLPLKRNKRKAVRVIEDDDEEEEEEQEQDNDETKEQDDDETKEEEEEEQVVVSVGERIKSRKRQAASPKRKKMKHKTELDLLHEDIQDMFIRDGVLTATGKRMCRLLKTDNEPKVSISPEPKRRTRNTAEKFDSKANSDKFKAMSNVRVLLPKISMDKLTDIDDDSQRYSLRRANKTAKSYVEVDSEDEREKEKAKELEKEKEKEKERQKEEERRLAKEKEEAERKEAEEREREKEKEKAATPKKMKKRAKAWASGVLPKPKKRKQIEEKADKSFEFVEPDKNYCSTNVWHTKVTCKLCDYNGVNITRHYRAQHPDSEVLISRLSPKKAEEAMKVAAELKLDEKEDHRLWSNKMYRSICRFCDFEMNCQPSSFYDHVSIHTGEYRHNCSLCTFSAHNPKAFKAHFNKTHSKDSFVRAACIKKRIYGYICTDCNFVQMTKKTVENHVNVYHLGEGKKIMKIHLSVADDESEKTTEEKESEDLEEPKAKKKKPNKTIEETIEEVVKPIKKEKEIDMTVFTCNTNIQEENQKIAQERLKKMTELAESVNTKRQSLNFVDQLSNRLLQEQKETETPQPEMVTVKSEPQDETAPLLEPELDTSLPEMTFAEPILEMTPKRPTKVMEPVASSVEVVQKDTSIIQGMIQKLQGILKEEKSEGPPPLAPLVEKQDELKAFISAGFLNINKTANGLEYSCRVPSCLFTSTNRDSFVLHWKEDHTRINQNYKMTKCRICLEDVKATIDSTLLLTFFAHVENEHLCGIRTSFNAGLISIDKAREGYEYICRVSMCIFITKNRDSFVTHLNEHTTSIETTKCGICQAKIASTDSDLLSTLFTHVEREHLEEEKPPKINILRTRRLSGDKLSMSKEESPELKESEENPFPFKISGVMSLADESVPPLSPIRDKPIQKLESVILKEAKMSNVEKAVTWKCAEALKKFLMCPRDLYKCPQFFCKYSTNYRHLFEGHLKAHARASDELVSCVYCDVKTPLSHSGLHIDLRHSNCWYSCTQCLYRALTREYVMVHNRLKHKDVDAVVALPPKTAKTIMMSKQKRFTVKDACQPYRCGYQGCNAQFLFLNEFCTHLQKCHDGIMMCGHLNNQQRCNFQCLVVDNMIDHWRTHSCYHYHCLLCKMGCMEMYTMLEHYSVNHPNTEPTVVDRRTSPSSSQIYAYSDEAALKILYVKEELLESINMPHVTMIASQEPPPETSKTPKSVTLVPLSVFQSNPSEAKKIIAIIPNTKVITSAAAVAAAATATATSTPVATASFTASPTVTFTTPISKPATSTPFIFASTEESSRDDKEEGGKADGAENESSDGSADPLSLDGEVMAVGASGDESDATELNDSGDLKSFGLIGYQLYRCSVCDISFSNARDFKAHTMHSKQCRDPTNLVKPYKCVHCGRVFKNPHGLLEHIQYHGQLRFGCSLCVKKFPSSFSLKLHMRSKHNVTHTVTTPLISNKVNLERDEFILRPVSTLEGDSKEGSRSLGASGQKTTYGPDEIEKLPKRYIFNSDIKCSLCPYSTKVRTNLVRHLQFHSAEKSVPDMAPVNPVPCLDKNEKMFDKMTNLAISSFSGGRMGGIKQETKAVTEEEMQVPAYVPSHRRYVCCAEECNYLCLEEANLRHHLYALHEQEPSFTCSHCKMDLKTDVESFLKHLKLHDLHLYKCSSCSFVHNLRHKVDKHATDKHPEKPASTVTIRSMEAELKDSDQSAIVAPPPPVASDPPVAPNIKWTKPWHCGMCKYRCAAKNDILTHIFNKHDINTQFKCTLCSYKTDEKHTFESHFKENHPDNDIDIIYMYYKSEGAAQQTATSQKQFDTTPLWQRDRPRVRHIRGILFEESNSTPQKMKKAAMGRTLSATPPQTPSTSTLTSNLDLAIDAVAKGIEEVATTMTKREPISSKADESSMLDDMTMARPIDESEVKDDGVIIIDDDDDDDEEIGLDVSKLDESNDNLMIDDDLTEGREVKKEMDKEFLSDDILFDKYGKLCMPQANAFKCPLCTKYRNKKVASFVHHVLTEMKCHRFQCNTCNYGSVTLDAMSSHCQERNHNPRPNKTTSSIDKTIEYWLQSVIKYQSKHIVQQIAPPAGESKSSTSSRLQCEYCTKWFRNVESLNDHELCHWSEHSYKCDHCCSELPTLDELFQHTFLIHPSYEVSFTTDGPYVGKIIAALKPPQGGAVQPETAPPDEKKYSCVYCSENGRTLETLKIHVEECHEGEEFRYKVSTAKTKVDYYCCGHCHERGVEEFIVNHHKEKHRGLELHMYQYICLECSGTFSNNKELRGHFSVAHAGKKLTYSCIENKPGGLNDYACLKCPFRSSVLGVMRSHLKKHLRPVDCLTCGATFIYPTEARSHHNKEHPDLPERVEENREKLKEYEDSVAKIVTASRAKSHEVIPQPSVSTPPPPPPTPPVAPRKMLARKSTGAPFVREYSYYGQKKEDTDLSKVTTSIEVNTVTTKVTVEQFSNIFNIFPVVEVKDCAYSVDA